MDYRSLGIDDIDINKCWGIGMRYGKQWKS